MSEENRTVVVTFTLINGTQKQAKFYEKTKREVMELVLERGSHRIFPHEDAGLIFLDKVLYIEFEEY